MVVTAGAAVGLGNLWRFPYLVSSSGGAWFLLLYVVLTLGVGLPLLLAEIAVGRRSRSAPVRAFRALGGRRWALLGYLQIVTAVLISAFYTVIAGWTIRYAVAALTGSISADPAGRFQTVASGAGAYGYAVLYLGVILSVLLMGLRRGVERAALTLLPVLVLLLLGLAVWASTIDGVSAAYRFYLLPRPGALEAATVVAAAGHAFFSLGLGMGVSLTLGSYVGQDDNLLTQAGSVALADLSIALLAGFVTIPLVYLFAGESAAQEGSTIGTLFISIPGALNELGAAGRALGAAFFATLALAALTSGIPTMEMITVSLMEEIGWTRPRAALSATLAIVVLAAPPAASLEVLAWMDRLAGELLLIVGGLALAIFAGWRFTALRVEVARGAGYGSSGYSGAVALLLRFVIPLAVAAVLVLTLRGFVGGG